MGLISKALIITAFVGGYYLHDTIHTCPEEPTKLEQIVEPKKEATEKQFSFHRLKYHSNGVFQEVSNLGHDIKPEWVKEYVDKPIIKYLK